MGDDPHPLPRWKRIKAQKRALHRHRAFLLEAAQERCGATVEDGALVELPDGRRGLLDPRTGHYYYMTRAAGRELLVELRPDGALRALDDRGRELFAVSAPIDPGELGLGDN